VQLGPYTLSSNLFLSPLAGYTNLPFRLTLRELGGLAWTTCDLVNARSLIERSPAALKLVASSPEDRPFAIQLFGNVPDEMREAARICQELGAQAVDINMGCPVKKVVRVGGGSAMMTELKQTAALVRGMVEAVKIPITAKMRLGWDDNNLSAPELAAVLEEAGVAAIFVHGRTRAQGFNGRVNLGGIRAVVAAVRTIPVIGNGDVTTPQAAKHMIDKTGCAGVSIGRGAFYDPWIFRRTDHYLRNSELLPEPDFVERVRVMRLHFERYCDFYGEAHGSRLFRKVAPWYAKRFGPAKPFKQDIITINSRADFETVLARYIEWRTQFCDAHGKLLSRYALDPLRASFMEAEADSNAKERAAIPVPRGPIEVW